MKDILEVKKLLRGNRGPAAIAVGLLFLAMVTAAVSAASDITDMPDTLKVDPLNGAWKSRVLPHQRLLVSFRDQDWNIRTFVGSKEDDNGNLTVSQTIGPERTRSSSEFSAGDSNNYVFASSVTEGVVPDKTVTLSEAFYGVSTFEGVPQNVLVTSYLVRHDGGTNCIWLDMWADGKDLGLYQLPSEYVPSYHFTFNADGSWKYAPALDQNTAHDIVASDWNGDGYSDYVLTYVKDTDKTLVKMLLIDGKSLYERMKNNTGEVIITHVNGNDDVSSILVTGSSVTGGLSEVKPANSIRMTKGDFDGDGRDEIALYYTLIHGNGANESRANQLEIYRVNYSDEKGYVGRCIYNTQNMADGSSFLQHNSVGIAAGDINNDGVDELVYIHTDSASISNKGANVYMSICTLNGDTLVRHVDRGSLGMQTFAIHGGEWTSVPPIEVKIADLDGDGFGELVWATGAADDGNQLKLWVHDWELSGAGAAITDTGKKYEYNAVNGGWWLNQYYKHHTLATGMFKYPSNGGLARHQIALGHMGGNTANDGTAHMDVAILSWSKESNIINEGSFSYNGVMMDGNMGASVAAVDLYGESLVLGSPSVFSVEDNIELMMVTQAPPKHWDKVSAKGSELAVYADENGDVTLDAYAVFDTDDYYTGMESSKSYGSTSTTTTVSEGSFGIEGSYALEKREKLKDKILNNHDNDDDPILDAGMSYTMQKVHNTTGNYSSQLTYSFSYRANRDDQLYYKANNYNLCRYPILLPESKRYSVTSDDAGETVSFQNYVQFVVPTTSSSTFTPTPGRSVSWYEPLHDNYNLFTYPKWLRDIKGYPQGTEAKRDVYEYDPWADINGKEFVSGTSNVIGNLDASAYTLTANNSEGDETYDSLRQTVAPHIYFHPVFGRNDRMHVNIDLTPDYTWGTDSTTTSDISKMLSVTMGWPGAANYTMYTNDWSAQDMQFKTDISYFTQDDGALCVGYAVPSLRRANSKIWGTPSPYSTHPDPGLLLPFRWGNDIKNSGTGNIESMVYYLVENDDRYSSKQMRGITFNKNDDRVIAATGSYEGLSTKLLEIGEEYNVALRVINYSFVDILDSAVTVKFYFQPWIDGGKNYPSADPAGDGYEEYGSQKTSLLGRTAETDNNNNWSDVKFTFTAPKTPGLGWLHAVVEYDREELSKDNNHGWVLIGAYDPAVFKGGAADHAEASRQLSAAALPATAERPDIRIKEVKLYEITRDAKGNISYTETPLDEKARGKKLRVDATVEFTGGKIFVNGKERQISYLPVMRCALFAGKRKGLNSILGASELPLLKQGESYTFSFVYDPKLCDYDNGVAVRAFSPYLFASEQRDPRSQYKVLWNSIEHNGGSGGCSAGLGALALLALLPLAWRKKR